MIFSNSKIYGKEPRYNETSIANKFCQSRVQLFVKSSLHCTKKKRACQHFSSIPSLTLHCDHHIVSFKLRYNYTLSSLSKFH